MNHDDLCPQAYPYGRDDDLDSFFGKKDWDCRCELINKVRADQKLLDKQTFAKVNLDWYNEFMENEGSDYYDWFEVWLNQYKTTLIDRFYKALS